jgi:hypothetical protein
MLWNPFPPEFASAPQSLFLQLPSQVRFGLMQSEASFSRFACSRVELKRDRTNGCVFGAKLRNPKMKMFEEEEIQKGRTMELFHSNHTLYSYYKAKLR